MASPPKPWEQAGASTPSAATPTSTTSTTSPAIPPRPESLTASVNQNAAAYSRVGNPGYGSYGGGYPSTYSSPAYGSPYNTYGGYGGMGGYGGGMYGSGYGGYRSMGYGGMYGGMGGGMPDPNNPESLTHRVNQSTQATFQVLEGIVGAFGGFAQMLESTYMTTHSSFYGMLPLPWAFCQGFPPQRADWFTKQPWSPWPNSLETCEILSVTSLVYIQ